MSERRGNLSGAALAAASAKELTLGIACYPNGQRHARVALRKLACATAQAR
ncbi:hypothetical protein [Photorhabdus sp. RM71S]|uniref:hypothetical protein n=1 Tax=Photorhabdus sp. RM71S TaxID=3342824 RepID=UPI0036DCC950